VALLCVSVVIVACRCPLVRVSSVVVACHCPLVRMSSVVVACRCPLVRVSSVVVLVASFHVVAWCGSRHVVGWGRCVVASWRRRVAVGVVVSCVVSVSRGDGVVASSV
jgi:hypothetical protein